MRSQRDRSSLLPANAFDETFLAAIDQLDEPMTAAEAEAAGPWTLQEMADGNWGVFRRGQSPERGDVPVASFRRRETALLAAAVLPGTGREPLYRLGPEPGVEGFALKAPDGEVEGHLRLFDEPLKEALHVVDCLVRSPEALARLLEAAGGIALRETGRLLRRSETLGLE
ncbi:MAG TPA: hypothetical protein VF756_15670 [Thermoanaerobaculia bacterium]